MSETGVDRESITVHGFSPSGNCHKVKLLLEQLGRPYRWVETRSDQGATRTAEFLALNPNAKVPVLVRADGAVLTESNAMLCWLAEGSEYLPADAWDRAQALSWMFFEQYSHEPYVAVARFICGWTPIDSPRRADLPKLRERAHAALAVMERHLSTHAWFTGARYGIADIALFAYTAVAGEGGVSLDAYPRIRDWLARVRATPRFTGLPDNDADVRERLAASA
ncbi:MAG TPA: glutathione S-transferase family protein [Lysobacter sp.]|nr:glutathione S-transferase family protein [Lysobacter sp.]